jgi:hypothetical protein
MEPRALLQALGELAREVGVEVRKVPSGLGEPGEAPARSGVCRVGGRLFVLLAATDSVEDRIEALVEGLRAADPAALEGRFLPPAVRARLEGELPP